MSVDIRKSYSKLNEKLAGAFDSLGVRRSATIPYTDGHDMADHVNAVQAVAMEHGGFANNVANSYHHAGKRGWDSADGETTLHPVEKLRMTTIPKDSKVAKEAIEAAQEHVNNLKKLLGDDDPDVQATQNQLNLVKRSDGTGMNLFDFGVMLQQIMTKPTQKVAKQALLGTGASQAGGETSPEAPGGDQGGEPQQEAQGGAQAAPQGQEAAQAPAGGQAQPESQGGTPQQAAQPQQA